ncbi:hypothetical protein OUZ56_031453 [Daphnia magna]|uniref:GMP synthase n=1 Tax=Daphnia magna TaxID=35525 RepID=A0ABQ9ZUA0_9CRUS|nr:hypothetical protein OUZ56_031453 [Daphnia magna]
MVNCRSFLFITVRANFVDKSFPGRQPTTTMRVREQCVESDIALETPGGFLLQQDYKVIIISGGPNSVCAVDARLYDPAIFRLRSSSAWNLLWQANTQQGVRWNGGEKKCSRWVIRDPSRNGVPIV